jgi:Capsular polysaccharide synthesis protein
VVLQSVSTLLDLPVPLVPTSVATTSHISTTTITVKMEEAAASQPPIVPKLPVASQQRQPPQRESRTHGGGGIPHIVWMFWGSGWPARDHPEANMALYSFQSCNDAVVVTNDDDPTDDNHRHGVQIRPLNSSSAEHWSRRKDYIPDATFWNLTIQAQSDIYRTLLLYHYGGVWADASLIANAPLSEWLDWDHTDDLLSFVRHDNLAEQKKKDIDPWITSWFLASPPHGYIVSRIVHDYFQNRSEHGRFTREYFWWHRMVSELARSDPDRIGHRIRTVFASADPLHCHPKPSASLLSPSAPMFKRCHTKSMYAIMATTHVCCNTDPNQDNNNETGRRLVSPSLPAIPPSIATRPAMEHLCRQWNCTAHPTDNVVPPELFQSAWGQTPDAVQFFQSLFDFSAR